MSSLFPGLQTGLFSLLFLSPGSLPPEMKGVIAGALLAMAMAGCTVVCCLSQRARDAAFLFLTGAMVLSQRMDVNFISREWYRGTTRGIEVSLLDMIALSILISAILVPRYRPRLYWPKSLGLLALFLLYECISTATAQPKLFGLFEISKTVRAVLMFLAAASFVRSERELRLVVVALAFTLGIEGLYSIKHRLVFHMSRATGTFSHPNSLSMYLCMTAPVVAAAAMARWQRFDRAIRRICLAGAAAACLAILLTVSRAGIPMFALVVGATVALCDDWRITPRKGALVLAAFAALGVMVAASWSTLAARFGESTLKEEMAEDKFENRGQYIGLVKEIIKDRPHGVGLNNWSYWVSKVYGRRTGAPYNDYDDIPAYVKANTHRFDIPGTYAPPAHNLAIITLGELGLPGLLIFGLLWLRWFGLSFGFLWRRLAHAEHRVAVGIFFGISGVFLQSLTEWTFRETDILMTFHLLMGVLASLYFIRKRASVDDRAIHDDGRIDPVAGGGGKTLPIYG